MHLNRFILFLVVTLWAPIYTGAESFEGMSYLDDGKIRIGVNLDIGGAITFLSESGDSENIINSHDWGRQIQMSFYSGPNPFVPNGKEPSPYWKFLGWNPIQSGDAYANESTVTEHTNDGTSLYLKCIPMQWPLDNEPGECIFEVWIELDNGVVKVRSKIINARADTTQYNGRGQELPALYSNGTYYRLFTYDGDDPFAGKDLRQITKVWDTKAKPNEIPGGPWDNWIATENWAALLNAAGRGVGIWTPGTYTFKGGFAGKAGKGGPKDGPTGYISPIRREILDHNIEYEYSYTLVAGTLEEIRGYVYEHANRQTLPDYNFDTDRQSWILADAKDDGWRMVGEWNVRVVGKNPRLIGPKTFWRVSDVDTIYIRMAISGGASNVTLQWEGLNGKDAGQKRFDTIPDGKMYTYLIKLAEHGNYRNVCTRLSLVLPPGCKGVLIDRISYKADE